MAVGRVEGAFEEGAVGASTLAAAILAPQHLAIPPISSKILLRRPSGGLVRKLTVSRAIFTWLMLS